MDRRLLLLVVFSIAASAAGKHFENVVYWGQNSASSTFTNSSDYEQPLSEVCKKHYTTVVIGFVDIFFDTRNPGTLPGINLSNHCGKLYPGYTSLLDCSDMADQIKECQSNEIKVMISLGGAAGQYGFTSDDQAEQFATTIWNMFLGGNDANIPRPFGDAVLDGVDLDIEGGASTGYTAFVTKLRALMTASDNQYFISAAPQCPFPDAYLGPSKGKPLMDAIGAFNFLNVQFYNNYCKYTTGNATQFTDSWNKWSALINTNANIKIMVGLFVNPKGNGYVDPTSLSDLFKLVADDPAFGGAMVWDASWSQNNLVVVGSETVEYSQLVYQILATL